MTIYVEAKVCVSALHCWPGAPFAVGYLRSPHRHLFVIRARKVATHEDRDVEILMLGDSVRAELSMLWSPAFQGVRGAERDFKEMSCEAIARYLIEKLGLCSCSVHEDDENGAIVEA
jgi:hypothetical protein